MVGVCECFGGFESGIAFLGRIGGVAFCGLLRLLGRVLR